MDCREQVKLSDVLQKKGYIRGPFGSALKRGDMKDAGIPVYEQQHAIYDHRDFRYFIDDKKFNAMQRFQVKTNDLIISCSGTVGKVSIIKEGDPKGIISQALLILRADTGKILPEYLQYFFTSREGYNAIVSRSSGSVQVNISKRDVIEQIPIRLPSLDLQKKVVDILGQLDKKIKTNEKINKNLEQQAVAVFNKFYDASTNQQPFTTLINVLGGGTPKTGNPEFWDGSIPFFTPKDVGTPYTFKTEKYITELGLKHCNSRLYPTNTTFVTARGTVGKISLAGAPMAMNQSCYALTSDIVDPLLVYFYVLKAVNALKHKASGAVFDAIVTRDFDGEIINILSDADSEAALSIIKPMMEAIHNNSKENMRLSAVRDTLLPKLMSAELDVSDLDL